MHVEIFSDIACPWCYVGKRRFERALEGFEHRDEVEVTWRAFQLDPSAPAERPGNYLGLLAKKYGRSEEEAAAMLDRDDRGGAAEGLDLRFDLIRPANTLDGHRLVHLAATLGRQDAMKERLMRAYLSEGELISDHATLARLAARSGCPPTASRRCSARTSSATGSRPSASSAPASGSPASRSSPSSARSARRAPSRPRSWPRSGAKLGTLRRRRALVLVRPGPRRAPRRRSPRARSRTGAAV